MRHDYDYSAELRNGEDWLLMLNDRSFPSRPEQLPAKLDKCGILWFSCCRHTESECPIQDISFICIFCSYDFHYLQRWRVATLFSSFMAPILIVQHCWEDARVNHFNKLETQHLVLDRNLCWLTTAFPNAMCYIYYLYVYFRWCWLLVFSNLPLISRMTVHRSVR